MLPPRFEYLAPNTLDEALSLLSLYGPEAKLLAGGQSLIPLMKLRLASPTYIVDINRIPGLDYVEEEDGWLKLGALTRHSTIEHSELVQRKYPLMADAAAVIADPLVRNMGTVGGSLAHADPAGDWGSVMLALGAQVVARGPAGERVILID